MVEVIQEISTGHENRCGFDNWSLMDEELAVRIIPRVW